MVDVLTATDARQNARLLVHALRGHEHGHGLADRFLCRVAEHALRAPVPTGNDAVEVLLTMASSEDSTIAASLAFASSARFRSVMSLAILDAPTTRPSSSLMGEIVRETGMAVPSS